MYSVDIPTVIHWLRSSLRKENRYRMKQDDGLKHATQNFLGLSETVRHCDRCKTPFRGGALDHLSEEFVCPICDNGKDEE